MSCEFIALIFRYRFGLFPKTVFSVRSPKDFHIYRRTWRLFITESLQKNYRLSGFLQLVWMQPRGSVRQAVLAAICIVRGSKKILRELGYSRRTTEYETWEQSRLCTRDTCRSANPGEYDNYPPGIDKSAHIILYDQSLNSLKSSKSVSLSESKGIAFFAACFIVRFWPFLVSEPPAIL